MANLGNLIGMMSAKHFGGRRDRHKRAKSLFFAKKRNGGFPF